MNWNEIVLSEFLFTIQCYCNWREPKTGVLVTLKDTEKFSSNKEDFHIITKRECYFITTLEDIFNFLQLTQLLMRKTAYKKPKYSIWLKHLKKKFSSIIWRNYIGEWLAVD